MSTTTTPLTGRAAVRNTLYNFLYNPPVTNLNQVFTSFPKRINFQVNSQPGQLSRSAVIIFIQSETESRLAIGGAHSGWKRIDYSIILQVYQHSLEPDSQAAMVAFDTLIDSIKERLRSNHNFGDESGTLVWQGAEPVINATYGEPATVSEGATETFAELQFDVTQMIQA
jgi:hypothetical protein